jgi:tetratricopeptide (TPR) repeat protein
MKPEARRELDRARRLHREGDARRAMRIYTRLLDAYPGQPDLLILAATAALQLERDDQAETLARSAVGIRPDGPGWLTLGRVLLQRGDDGEAMECFRQARADPTVAADAAFHQGQLERAAGRLDAAAEALGAALDAAPAHGPAWNELGVVRMAQTRYPDARECFRKSLDHRPDHAPTQDNLVRACIELGDLASAEQALGALLRHPDHQARAQSLLGRLRKLQGRLDEAAAAWRRATETAPHDAGAWTGLATTLQALADYAGAEAAHGRALALAPGDADIVAARAEWLEWQGRYQEGIDSLHRLDPEQRLRPGPALVTARLWRRMGDPGRARDLLTAALPGEGSLRRPFCFSLGDACDELGDYAAAWSWYEEGNRLTPAVFDPSAQARLFEQVEDAAGLMPAGQGGEDLVFVVGMPRSGTSLLEQMLSGHPDVHGAGELPLFGELAHGALAAPGAEREARLADLAAAYRRGLPDRPRGCRLLIDKMPLNFQYLPLIRRAFPGARVIHCRRDLRDIGISCFFTDFADQALGFAARLPWLASFLSAYRRIMERWSRDGDEPLTMDYERLVEQPEESLRGLLQAMDLPWDPRCLAFEQRERIVATASHAQVRQPLYRRSIGRWRHYEPWIGPLADLDGVRD